MTRCSVRYFCFYLLEKMFSIYLFIYLNICMGIISFFYIIFRNIIYNKNEKYFYKINRLNLAILNWFINYIYNRQWYDDNNFNKENYAD